MTSHARLFKLMGIGKGARDSFGGSGLGLCQDRSRPQAGPAGSVGHSVAPRGLIVPGTISVRTDHAGSKRHKVAEVVVKD